MELKNQIILDQSKFTSTGILRNTPYVHRRHCGIYYTIIFKNGHDTGNTTVGTTHHSEERVTKLTPESQRDDEFLLRNILIVSPHRPL